MNDLKINENDSDLIKALKDWFQDHYKHFDCYPMEFEYDEITYNFEECSKLLGWNSKSLFVYTNEVNEILKSLN